jgi:hypothetical protein
MCAWILKEGVKDYRTRIIKAHIHASEIEFGRNPYQALNTIIGI